MFNISKDELKKILLRPHNNSVLSEDIADHLAEDILQKTIYIGKHVWVVARRYPSSKWEVIQSLVTRETLGKRKSFTVEGKWSNGSYYNASFTENSIGKVVFLDLLAASKMKDLKNSK